MNTRMMLVTALLVAGLPLSVQAAKRVTGTVDNVNPSKNEL